jgi:tetratricopeptide (TPR) repeat protein
MKKNINNSIVKIGEEEVRIPTYKTGKPNKLPMFFEKRVYQGSSGKVYPYPVIDKIYDDVTEKKHKVVFLENEFLRVMIMPSLGGRIQAALDKTNNYNFIYNNNVIKPALVGLLGPWISGGIEFNWPQHHRPSTFQPVDYKLCENDDGSKTVWLGEIELMSGIKEIHGITLRPGKAYIEINVKIYNRQPYPVTFLWWANPAVSVNDSYQSVFPPDVNSIADHGKRDISRFPIAIGEYYKVDYSKGVDISLYKNIPVPSSMMATKSKYDFVGGYDHNKKAGILHVADHHISPGKKMWTWGTGDFGKAWEKQLTDRDGPYIELMTGVYTDNQPDFSWLQPQEMKMFTQYFMPYKEIGLVKNASHEIAVNLLQKDNKIMIAVYSTSKLEDVKVSLLLMNQRFYETVISLSPEKAFLTSIEITELEFKDVNLKVEDKNGREIISYSPEPEKEIEIPEPAKQAEDPKKIQTNEELFLTGLHLEQYRHVTFDPDSYYLEALERDEFDVRCNNAYGLLLLKKGLFNESRKYFENAVKRLTDKNPNPYDSEPYYNLGLSLMLQNKFDKAYDAFYKSTWSGAWQASGFYQIAVICCIRQKYNEALNFINISLSVNSLNLRGRNLKTFILRKINQYKEAINLALLTISIDLLNFAAIFELYKNYLLQGDNNEADKYLLELKVSMNNNVQNFIELSLEYSAAGFYEEAMEVLNYYLDDTSWVSINPMVFYYLSLFAFRKDNKLTANNYAKTASELSTDYCFPHRLEAIAALQNAIELNPNDSNAFYLLGNLYYDKKQYDTAIDNWETSISIKENYPAAYRNLSIGYFNKKHLYQKAKEYIEKAFELDGKESRLLLELDILYKKLSIEPELRLNNLLKHIALVEERDDLYLELITLHNRLGDFETAAKMLKNHKFHPWEGGEGKVIAQYILAHTELAKELFGLGQYEKAIEHLLKCKTYPENLGEGKLIFAREENVDYLLGCAFEKLGRKDRANEYFNLSVVNEYEPSLNIYYNDQPSDLIFYQGLSFLKLNNPGKAKNKFNKLIEYGEKSLFKDIKIDYFAVSLPDFLVYEDNLKVKNEVNCRYLMALGYVGLEKYAKAKDQFIEVLNLDVSHQGAYVHFKEIENL